MAVRTAYVGVSGAVLTAANLNKLPGGWIGYNEVTANQTAISTETLLTGLSLTVTVGTGRRIRVSFAGDLNCAIATTSTTVSIKEGATYLRQQILSAPSIANYHLFGGHSVVLTPTAAAHTYTVSLIGAGSTVDLIASATAPAYLLVEDIGATP